MYKLDLQEREIALEELLSGLKCSLSDAKACDSDDAGEIISLLEAAIGNCKENLDIVSELVAEEDRQEQHWADYAFNRDCTMASGW